MSTKYVFVTGEISNFKNHYSGHMYMTIKDEGGAIKAVMFSSYASRLKFVPENGMKVIIFGSVSLYNKDGSYQLYITDMQPDGVGALNLAYEQLKEKLQNEGLFNAEFKKPIPEFPQKIGVMTAPDGAAVRDIFSVLKRIVRERIMPIINTTVKIKLYVKIWRLLLCFGVSGGFCFLAFFFFSKASFLPFVSSI